eukprot:COSAG04_NODE_2937_length_3370_cov_22.289820_1_plen_86_part_10
MTGLLSQREIEAFKRDGWFVRRSILDPELCRQYDRHPAPPHPHPTHGSPGWAEGSSAGPHVGRRWAAWGGGGGGAGPSCRDRQPYP